MFDARGSASIPPPAPVAVEVAPSVPVLSLLPGPISTRKGKGSPAMKVCPDCLETVLKSAPMCVYCRYDFESARSAWPLTGIAAAS